MLIIKIILILIAAFFLCAAIQGIIRANRMTPEEQAAFLQDYKARRKQKKRKKKTYAPYDPYQDPDAPAPWGGYLNPEQHERKERRNFKKWMRSIK